MRDNGQAFISEVEGYLAFTLNTAAAELDYWWMQEPTSTKLSEMATPLTTISSNSDFHSQQLELYLQLTDHW